ncbi:hypothetical protein EJ08DRAFT_729254 [Tothia fuscella]|uniref:Uncharacterized protein n=1 Tax=Tothia fuscella TaxID=1048955 RepID=A0A9P4U3K4_9PEZI|nr:hypothetical protein EJ08DRAFT_729254 [Tothia fuscella]
MLASLRLFLAVGSASAFLFSQRSDPGPDGENIIDPHPIILPQHVQGKSVAQTHTDADMQPSVTIVSVYNETRGSAFHPFACYEHPDFFSGQKKKWATGSKQRFELSCWTNPVFQTQTSKGSRTPWAFAAVAFDNDITWFHGQKEKCWFPDFVVQKDAQYGPSFGNGLGENVASTTAAAAKGSSPAKATPTPKPAQWGPPWMRGGGPWSQGGPPWMGWGSFNGNSNGPTAADDLKNKLRFCPTPVHQVGTFREQYNGKTYCYKCTRLDCANRPLSLASVNSKLELSCYSNGNVVESDSTWWKVRGEDDCYVPNQVFDPLTFLGNAGECPK